MSRTALWITLAACIVLIAGIGIGVYHSGADAFRDRIHDELLGIATLKMKQLSSWYADEFEDAGYIAADHQLTLDVGTLSRGGNGASRRRLAERLDNIRREHGYLDVVLLDTTLAALLSSSSAAPSMQARQRWAESLSGPKDSTVVTDPYRRSSDSLLGLDFIAPIRDGTHTPIAYLVLRVDFTSGVQDLVEYWPTHSASAETFLLMRDSTHAVYLNNLRRHATSALAFRIPMDRRDVPGVRALLGETGIVEGVDYNETRVIAFIGSPPGTPWALVAKVDKEEIHAPLRLRAITVSGITALMCALVAAALMLFHNRQRLETFSSLYHAEKELAESRNFFQTTIYSIAEGVITTDGEGIIRQMNAVAETLTGWREIEAAGFPLAQVFRIIAEDDRRITESPVQKILRDGAVVGLANHTLLIHRSGREIPILDSGAPIRDSDGTIIGIVLVFRDQTEERRAHRQLEESEEKYRNLLEASTDAILVNQDNRFVYCNPAALTLMGAERREDILGKSPFDVFHPDDHEQIRNRIRHMLETGQPVDRAHERVFRLDGSVVDVDVTAVPFTYLGKTAIHVVLHDITERLATARKLEETLAAAEKANSVKSLFLTNISHELRTPLNNILGYNSLIRETCAHARGEEVEEFFLAVESSGHRLLRTMHSILEIARIQSGTYERSRESCRLDDLLAPLIDQYRETARQKHIAFVYLEQGHGASASVDVESLRIAIGHLIDNAVKFTENGGVSIRVTKRNPAAEVSITDTGIGMSAEFIAKLREPFSQESEGFTKKYQGIGLGLSIAVHHLEANHVDWELRSEAGKGTTFILRFP